MNLPNALTILRIFFVPLLVAALVQEKVGFQLGDVRVTNDWLSLAIFLVAAGTALLRSQVRPLATNLHESREQFRAVTETASDAIISADRQGTIVYFNRAAERIFGYSAREALGEPLTLLMPERFQQPHTLGLQRFLATRQARIIGKTLELVARKKDGKEFPIEISVASWGTPKGTFFTAILRDITARKQAEETLKGRTAELEARFWPD